MSFLRLVASVLGMALWFAPSCGWGLTLKRAPMDTPNNVGILLSGQISLGDTDKLRDFLLALPTNDKIIGLFIDSPGGNVIESERLARLIRQTGLPLGVPNGSFCASACFLLFAAAKQRLFGPQSYIGVHSVSHGGLDESLADMGFTTALARDASDYGVPPAIVGKLVLTPPGQMAWLTGDELRSMGALYVPPAPIPAGAPTVALAAPVAKTPSRTEVPQAHPPSMSPAQQVASTTQAFADGRRDRIAWEAWFSGLPLGRYRDGALFWTGARSKAKPSICTSPYPGRDREWSAGCLAAQARLAPIELRRNSEPNYWWGWNSL